MDEKQKQFEEITEEIKQAKSDVKELVEGNEFDKARIRLKELKRFCKKSESLKKAIQKEAVTAEDVQVLRSIEPHRKSVQNMTDIEVAQTPKFEKLLGEEMGVKSPYEMRNSNNEWRDDERPTVPVIAIQNRVRPKDIAEIKRDKTIEYGTFINRDTGIAIQFSNRSVREIISKAIPDDKRHRPVDARMAALYQMREIIENAVCFDSQISEYNPDNSKNKSPNTLFIHRMYGAVKYGNNVFLANLAVEEFYSKTAETEIVKTANRLYSFRDIEITPVKLLGLNTNADPLNANKDTSQGVINISIAQLYKVVKTFDERFFENPTAIGRTEREDELRFNEEFDKAREKLEQSEGLQEKIKKLSSENEQLKANCARQSELISEVNAILVENPKLKEDYKVARDEYRETNPPSWKKQDKQNGPKPPKSKGTRR